MRFSVRILYIPAILKLFIIKNANTKKKSEKRKRNELMKTLFIYSSTVFVAFRHARRHALRRKGLYACAPNPCTLQHDFVNRLCHQNANTLLPSMVSNTDRCLWSVERKKKKKKRRKKIYVEIFYLLFLERKSK